MLVQDQLPDAGDQLPSGVDGLSGGLTTEVEKCYIRRTLDLTDGNREETSRTLEIGERPLYCTFKKYELRKQDLAKTDVV